MSSPQWAKDKARNLLAIARPEPGYAYASWIIDAFAEYISQHEAEPIDPDVLVVRRLQASSAVTEALKNSIMSGGKDDYPSSVRMLAEYKAIKQESSDAQLQ